MNTRKSIMLAVASLGLAISAQAALAAGGDHQVTQAQINRIQAGASASEVSRALGAPESVSSWMNGKTSMIYELSTPNDQQELVYVDLGHDNKVTDVQIIQR